MAPTLAASPPSSSVPSLASVELLPLFVGITGHRDLRAQDVEPLREAVKRELSALRARYPHTPMAALSPLGEGADRVMACVALELGFELMVPLPLARGFYEKSFSDDASREEFASLLARAQAVWTLPWIDSAHDNGNGSGNGAGTSRVHPTEAQIEGQYAAMGAYLARYSHVLLALWDGDDLPEHERTGGTAHIVRLRLHGAPPPYGPAISPLERAGYGAVHHILTPRQSRPLPEKSRHKPLFALQVLPLDDAAEDFSRIDVFNADVRKYSSTMSEQAHQSALSLLGSPRIGAGKTTDEAPDVPPGLRLPLSIYGWSDTLSTFFARQVTRTTKRIFGLVFLAALCFNLFHSLPHPAHPAEMPGPAVQGRAGNSHSSQAKPLAGLGAGRSQAALGNATVAEAGAASDSESSEMASSLWSVLPWFLWCYLALVALNVGLHGHAEKQELQNKYQDYRALAEGLRVQIFWRMAGLHDDVSDHYLGKQRGELNWIRHAIKSCNVLADAQGQVPDIHEAPLPMVVRQWAREQRNYYVGKTHREHAQLEKEEKIIRFLVVGSVVLTLLLSVLLSLPSLVPLPLLETLKAAVEVPLTHALIMISIVMLAVTAGLLHGYNAQLARAEHTKRYGRMGTLFQAACLELEAQLKASHSHKTTALLHELGREALAENGDWVMLHRERPLEVPHAG